MKIYTLPEMTDLEQSILRQNNQKLDLCLWKEFPDGEIFLSLKSLEKEAVILGRTSPPGENFFRTLLLVDTLRRAGAKKINLILPYFGYSRQDRKIFFGDALTSVCLRDSLARAGVTRIVTLDLHSQKIIEKSPVKIINLTMAEEFARAVKEQIGDEKLTVISPDYGGKHQAERLARYLRGGAVAWINKKRDPKTGKVTGTYIEGKKLGETVVIVDDILSTGKTIKLAYKILKRNGFKKFYLCITHPVFAPGGAALIRRLGFKRIFITDTLPVAGNVKEIRGLKILSAAKILAKVTE